MKVMITNRTLVQQKRKANVVMWVFSEPREEKRKSRKDADQCGTFSLWNLELDFLWIIGITMDGNCALLEFLRDRFLTGLCPDDLVLS